ncbi:RNA polymerase sigma factor [Niabella hirudinis]|uniref:RNA polymerase sigma factor n=1 Tax=Niabella hirudinis TaxID=1285929 RepID=UPI003EBA4206
MFKRLALGDESALDQIVKKYWHELLTRVFRILRNRYWAEEVLMDVFLELWKQRLKVGFMKYPHTWLHKVANNKAVDRFRKEFAHLSDSLEEVVETVNEQSPEEEMDSKEMKNIMASAIDQLPPAEKKVYVLRTVEGWPVKEIAAALGRSTNTIRNELANSRKSIQKIISNYLHLLLF